MGSNVGSKRYAGRRTPLKGSRYESSVEGGKRLCC